MYYTITAVAGGSNQQSDQAGYQPFCRTTNNQALIMRSYKGFYVK